jgi:hypothetical protein
MISEFFLHLGTSIAAWFLGLFGTGDPPAWIADAGSFIAEVFTRVQGLGAWMPLPLMLTVGLFVLGFWGEVWLVKGIRWLWGLTPFSGGS